MADPTTPAAAPPRSGWSTAGRVAIVVLVLGLTGMWIYALWGKPDVPGQLADHAFPEAAEPICRAARAEVEALPKAQETRDPNSRADVLDKANQDLDQMLAALRTHVPATEPAHTMVAEWLADWQTYVNDRKAYTAQLRTDPNVRFAVTQSERDNSQINNALNRFADINNMASCETPDDLG